MNHDKETEIVAYELRIEKLKEPGKPWEEPSKKYFKIEKDQEGKYVGQPTPVDEEEFIQAYQNANQEDIETFCGKSKHQVDPVAPNKVTDVELTTGIKVNVE